MHCIDGYYGNCGCEEASIAVRKVGEMAGVFTDYVKLLRLFFVFHLIGDIFLAFPKSSGVVKRFMYRQGSSDSSDSGAKFGPAVPSITLYKNLLTNDLMSFTIFPFLAGYH